MIGHGVDCAVDEVCVLVSDEVKRIANSGHDGLVKELGRSCGSVTS